MIERFVRRNLRRSLLCGLAFVCIGPVRAFADVCVTVDEARDTFSPADRSAAVLLLERQFELAGERIAPPGCADAYVVSHVRLGNTISITLTGAKGQRDAVAKGLDDVPAVYSQMVRSLLRGQPMEAAGVVDRTNVSRRQSDAPNRVYADSLLYARLGYGAVFGDRSYSGPSIGMIGYRRELDAFGIDVSFFNFQYRSSSGPYGLGVTDGSGSTGRWLALDFLRFTSPLADRSPYVGGGLSWSTANLNNGNTHWEGDGLQGELTAGYEVGRASAIRVFFQADVGLPFYRLTSTSFSYLSAPPYVVSTTSGRRYAPSITLSLGVGWQRGGR